MATPTKTQLIEVLLRLDDNLMTWAESLVMDISKHIDALIGDLRLYEGPDAMDLVKNRMPACDAIADFEGGDEFVRVLAVTFEDIIEEIEEGWWE